MFQTIDGLEHGVFYISSIKKDTDHNTLVFYLMNGGSIKEQYGSRDEMNNTYQSYMDKGYFIELNDRVFNIVHFATIAKADINDEYMVHIVIRTGETIIGKFATAQDRDDFYNKVISAGSGGGGGGGSETDPTVPSWVKSITQADIQKWNAALQQESDPTVPAEVKALTQQDIDNWNNKLDTESDPTVPQHVKDITQADINRWNNPQVSNSVEVYLSTKDLNEQIKSETTLSINDLDTTKPITELEEFQIIYSKEGIVSYIEEIDVDNDEITVVTITKVGLGSQQEIKRPFDYEVGYNYEITAGGQDYVVGDIVETDVTDVFVEVVEVDDVGSITAVKFTREKQAQTQGSDASITAIQNTNIYVIPDDYWSLEGITYDIITDTGAQVEFYKDDDILVKYNMGADSKVYEFTFDKDNGFITVANKTIQGGSPIVFAQTLPRDATTMKKGTLYVNDTGYSFTQDNVNLVYHENPTHFVTSLPSSGTPNELYVNLVDKTINTYSGNQWVVLGGGSNTEFDTKANFPIPGDAHTLYVATDENRIYRYDLTAGDYISVSTDSTIKSYSTTITGDNTKNVYEVEHNLDTKKVTVTVYDTTTLEIMPCIIKILTNNKISIGWGDNLPTNTELQVEILGW